LTCYQSSWQGEFIEKNPGMVQFLATEGVGKFEIKIDKYELVKGYGQPQIWDPEAP